jgi:hypothetical protein
MVDRRPTAVVREMIIGPAITPIYCRVGLRDTRDALKWGTDDHIGTMAMIHADPGHTLLPEE